MGRVSLLQPWARREDGRSTDQKVTREVESWRRGNLIVRRERGMAAQTERSMESPSTRPALVLRSKRHKIDAGRDRFFQGRSYPPQFTIANGISTGPSQTG